MGLKWTHKMTKLVIYLLRHEVCLWDVNNPHYTNKIIREQAIKSIAMGISQLNPLVTASDVRSKLHSLRTQYRKEYNIIDQSKRYAAASDKSNKIRKSTLWCYDLLNFWLPAMKRTRYKVPQNQISNTDLIFDPLEIVKNEDGIEIYDYCIDADTEQYSLDEEMSQNSLTKIQIATFNEAPLEEPSSNNVDDIEYTNTEYQEVEAAARSSQDNAEESRHQLLKLNAETRYYNEMADLAHTKRIMINLQSEKLRLELTKIHNSCLTINRF